MENWIYQQCVYNFYCLTAYTDTNLKIAMLFHVNVCCINMQLYAIVEHLKYLAALRKAQTSVSMPFMQLLHA